MKTLLFLLNNRRNAREAILAATQMAKILNVNLKILHISFPRPLSTPGIVVDLEMFHTNPEDYADTRTVEEIDKELIKLKTEGCISQNTEIEHKIGVSLFIVKKKFESGEFDYLALFQEENSGPLNTPTIPVTLIRNIPCPTWILPFNSIPKHFCDLMYMTDYQKADIHALQKIFEILPQGTVSSLDLVHLTDETDFQEELLAIGFENLVKRKTDFEECRGIVKLNNDRYPISLLINQLVNEKQIELIIVLKENRNLLQKVFYRSFTEKMLKNLNTPVLVLHQSNSQNTD